MAAGARDNTEDPSTFSALRDFLSRQWLPAAAVSAAILTPCFWQRRIQAGDLASHVYNAWLAQLIERGEAPGLWIARQWNNVLFDLTLHWLGNLLGLAAGEKIAVSAAVLVFFWGAFALASAAARRAAWPVAPCLAMVAYGWTFQMGFFNYYVSLGLAFFGLAVLWRGRSWERAATLLLAPVIWLAHPLGVVLLAGAGAWIVVTEHVSLRRRFIAGAAAIGALFFVRMYIAGRYQVFESTESRYFFNGADQLLLYGPQYWWPVALMLIVVLSMAATALMRRGEGPPHALLAVPGQLYGLALLTILLLPETIVLPQYAAPAGFLHERLSCICAVFACCGLAVVTSRRWHAIGCAAVAAMFFICLYSDTAAIGRMERRAEQIAAALPSGQRVLATIPAPAGSRVFIFHIVDRACIGRCFSWGNYEPGSGQFRVRANPGNRIVTTSMSASFEAQNGEYTVQQEDLPLWQVSRCPATELCARELKAGDVNGPGR